MTDSPRPWYRQLWPWLLMLPPAFSVVGGAVMVYLASSTPSALVVDDYARIEALTSERFARDRRAAQLNVAAVLTFASAPRRIEVALTVPAALSPPTLTLHARHATNPAADRTLTLARAGERFVAPAALAPGSYAIELLPADGSWRLGHDAVRPVGSIDFRAQAEPGTAPTSQE